VERHLLEREIPFRQETVTVRHGGEFREYPHLYLEEGRG